MNEAVLYYAECVRFALHQKGIEADDFENTDMRVYHRPVANPFTIFRALKKGGIIIPVVDAGFVGLAGGNVAVLLLALSDDGEQVRIYNPVKQCVIDQHIQNFLDSWDKTGGQCTTAFANDGTYMPKLIDLTYVELPDDLDELLEAMAENAHDMWARERQSEGWTYGPERNDYLLQTPDMVPYANLTESEKQYDRVMASDTLKLLTALGYKIVKE